MSSPVPPVERITPIVVFENASHINQAIVLILLLASVAALVLMVMRLVSGKRMPGGSAFLSGLRFAGPILGVVGACYAAFAMTMGVANVPIPVTLKMLAPGFAEMFLTTGLGFLTGVIAVFACWMTESRNRQGLSA